MTVEVFKGTPDALATRLVAIAAGNTVNFIVPSHQKGVYIILFT